MQPQLAPRAVVIVQQAKAGVEEGAAALRQRRQQLLGGKLGDERVAQLDEGGELRGVGAQPLELPEAVQHGTGLPGEAYQPFQRGFVEGGDVISVEVDDPDGMALDDERRRHLAAHVPAGQDVARLDGDIGHEQRFAMQGDPASDTLAGAQREFAEVGGQALLDADLELAALGAEEGEGAAVSRERGHDGGEDLARRCGGVTRAGRERGDAVKRIDGSRIHPATLGQPIRGPQSAIRNAQTAVSAGSGVMTIRRASRRLSSRAASAAISGLLGSM